MEGTTPTIAAVVTARSNHLVQMSSMLSQMSWRSRNPNSAHASENACETQIDTTMTLTVLIVSIEQKEEVQESRVHYTLAGIKSLLKIGGGGGGGVPERLEPSPGYAPVSSPFGPGCSMLDSAIYPLNNSPLLCL